MELTNGKPKLKGGQMIIDDHERGLGLVSGEGGHLHCAREDWGPESASFDIHEGEIRANDFIVFICAPSRLPAAGAGAPLTALLLQTSQTWRRGTGGERLASLHVKAFLHTTEAGRRLWAGWRSCQAPVLRTALSFWHSLLERQP